MTRYTADAGFQPKGDHNRRLSLGVDPDQFAAAAGITTQELRDYEQTGPDQDFDPVVADKVHMTLDALERDHPNLQTGRSEHAGTHAPVLAGDDVDSDHSRHQRLAESELLPPILENAPVYDVHSSEIARVAHLHGTGFSAQAVLRFGGILGLGTRHVSVPLSQLDFMRDENGNVHAVTRLSEDDLKAMPEHHHTH